MALSDVELICAAQSGGESSKQARNELVDRFGNLLRYFAGNACLLAGLDPSEIDDVVQAAVADLCDPDIARFDPARPKASVQSYLLGLVQNAARTHTRFVRQADDVRHDYGDPLNADRDLPSSPADIADGHDDFADAADREETARAAAAVLLLAAPDVMVLVRAVHYRGETPEQVALAIGVDRSTVARRLYRFYEQVRQSGLSYHAA